MNDSKELNIFISYAHKDQEYCEELLKFLKPICRKNNARLWTDQALLPGDEWDKIIKGALDQADLFLLLVSQNFIASDYIFRVELKTALQAYKDKGTRIIPIILTDSTWSDEEYRKFQALPQPPKPLRKWDTTDQAFTNIAYGVRDAIVFMHRQNP